MSGENPDLGSGASERKSPGARLRAAREAQGLRIATVAESLGLAHEAIVALEADDYNRLGAPVYVRGYLRKYARFLDLAGDELIAAYEQEAAPHDPEIRAHVTAGIPRQKSKRWLVSCVAVLVIVVLVLAAIWAWRHVRHAQAVARIPAATTVSSGTAFTKTVAPASAGSGSGSATNAIVPPTLPSAPASTPAASRAGIRLALHVRATCWIVVRDANGKRLYYDLAPAGETLDFKSDIGALTVFLGNADGVDVTVNGKAFPIPTGTRSGNTARFEVEPATASTS